MAFIHVVIPVYNAEAYLRQTVASVLEQPTTDIDIVLVNDGSTDGSAAICDELAAQEKRIRVIHQKNAGVSVARNTGIAYFLDTAADDDYLIFLDSDDIWAPGIFTPELWGEIGTDTETDVFVFGSCRVTLTELKPKGMGVRAAKRIQVRMEGGEADMEAIYHRYFIQFLSTGG